MANPIITKIGNVSAYLDAVAHGFEGTRAEFGELLANSANYAQSAESAASAASASATTATTKAGKATAAATDAQNAKTQTEQAASQALTDIATARSGAISAVQTEGQTQTANARAQAQAAATSATTASTKASEASASATSAGQSATNAAASATSAAQSASNAQDVLDSIPADYSDLSANVDQLKADLDIISEKTYNLVSYILTGLTVNTTGGMANYGGSTSMVVAPVVSGETYTIKTDDGSNFVGAFYEQKPTASTTASYNSQRIVSSPKTFTAPITGYVAFRTSNGYAQPQMVEGDTDKPYVSPLYAVDLVARQTLDTITTIANVTEPVTGVVTDGKTMTVGGTEQDLRDWEYETFQCAEGESYTATTHTGQYMKVWIVFDSSNHYVTFSQLPTTTPIGRQVETFTIPEGGVKFCVNNRKADGSISVVKNIPGEKTVNPNMVPIDDVPLPDVLAVILSENLLYGKTLCCCGDSITYGADMDAEGFTDESNCTVFQSDANGNFTETMSNFRKTWNWQIANRNKMTLYNAGVSGSTMQGLADKNGFSIANGRYTKLPENIDYLLIWFGWNDTAYGTLGTITDTTNETYYGGYNVVLPYLIDKYPYAKIALIVPFGTDANHRNAIRQLGNKWGVAVWDNYQGGTPLYYGKEDSVGVDASVVTANRAKFQANGAHPNYRGHKQLADMIEQFLRSI